MAGRLRKDKVDGFLLKRAVSEVAINTRAPSRARPPMVGPNDAPRAPPFMRDVRQRSRVIPDVAVGLQVGYGQLGVVAIARPTSVGPLSLGMDAIRGRSA